MPNIFFFISVLQRLFQSCFVVLVRLSSHCVQLLAVAASSLALHPYDIIPSWPNTSLVCPQHVGSPQVCRHVAAGRLSALQPAGSIRFSPLLLREYVDKTHARQCTHLRVPVVCPAWFSDADGRACGPAVQMLSMSLGHWVKVCL